MIKTFNTFNPSERNMKSRTAFAAPLSVNNHCASCVRWHVHMHALELALPLLPAHSIHGWNIIYTWKGCGNDRATSLCTFVTNKLANELGVYTRRAQGVYTRFAPSHQMLRAATYKYIYDRTRKHPPENWPPHPPEMYKRTTHRLLLARLG